MAARKKKVVVGTKEEVYEGRAEKTAGGLRKKDIMKIQTGKKKTTVKYVSKKQHENGKRAYEKYLKGHTNNRKR